jgi:addiction module RelE/StbE family toxin
VILIWAARAGDDLEGVQRHVAQDNPSAALALSGLIHSKADLLIDHPHLGRPGRRRGTRELVAHPNYILIYDVTRTTVRILRVMHAARQWPPKGGGGS